MPYTRSSFGGFGAAMAVLAITVLGCAREERVTADPESRRETAAGEVVAVRGNR